MSSVVISNRSIFNQKISNIEKNKVLLPFNVTKEQEKKIKELLSKVKVTFLSEPDKLTIKSLAYKDTIVKSSEKELNNCRFSLSKTYVVTMKQNFVTKVKMFYDRVIAEKIPQRPVFDINKETNLKEALQEATVEIDINTINASLNSLAQESQEQVQPNQVLANNPLGETVIENPINLNNTNQEEIQAPVAPVLEQAQPQNNVVQQPAQVVQEQVIVPTQEVLETPAKVKKRRFSRGSILAVPIVVVWLGVVFYGTVKLVTNILT